MTKITGIVSVGPKLEIGAQGSLLYSSTSDMAFFCGYTQGKVLIMGRKTAETIPGSLPGRDVICVSHDIPTAKKASVCVSCGWDGENFSEVLEYAAGRDIVVVGGSEIYKMFIGKYDEFFVTINTKPYENQFGVADNFFDERCLLGLGSVSRAFRDKTNMFEIVKYSKE